MSSPRMKPTDLFGAMEGLSRGVNLADSVGFTVSADGTRLAAPGNSQTADQIGNFTYLYGKGTNTPYFAASNFATPIPTASSPIRFGNTGRNRFRGPGRAGIDFNLLKNFAVTEKFTVQFRAEAQNLTNTPQFARANTTLNDPNFGRVTGTTNVGPRNIQLGLRIQF